MFNNKQKIKDLWDTVRSLQHRISELEDKVVISVYDPREVIILGSHITTRRDDFRYVSLSKVVESMLSHLGLKIKYEDQKPAHVTIVDLDEETAKVNIPA